MSKKGLLEKKEVSSASPSSASAATPLRMSENPFIAPEKKEVTTNPFVSSKSQYEETNEEIGSGSAFSASEQESYTPEKTTPSIVNKPKAIEANMPISATSASASSPSSMVPPSASDRKKKR